MALTIHGWPVLKDWSDQRLRQFKIPGTTRNMTLRGDVGPYLVAFASEYHKLIAPLDKGTFDDWSYTVPRLGRASSSISDHSGGVAIDLNATKEGAQSQSNVTWWKHPVRAARLARLRRKYHLLEWGGSYTKFYDPMHWTFKYGVSPTQVKAEMKRLGIDKNGRIAT